MDVPRSQPTLLSGRLILLCVMILAVAGAIIGLSLSVPDKGSSGAVATTQPFFNPTPTDLIPGIPNPSPWQYDPVTNKHWNPLPGHLHWHTGQPPPPDQRQAAGQPVTPGPPPAPKTP